MGSECVEIPLYNHMQRTKDLKSEKVGLRLHQKTNDVDYIALSDMRHQVASVDLLDVKSNLGESEFNLTEQERDVTQCHNKELCLRSPNIEVQIAIDAGNCPRLRQLVQMHNFDVNELDMVSGETYLHRVVCKTVVSRECVWVPMVYTLSNAGINLDAKDNTGRTAVHVAIRHCLLAMMVACLKVGAQADDSHEELISKHTGFFAYEFSNWYRKLTPGYWEAVSVNNVFRVNKLIKSWSRINIQRDGESLIEYARRIGANPKIIESLLINEASIDFAHATISGDEIRMKSLLCDHSVQLDTKDYSDREDTFSKLTPLTLKQAAIRYGHHHILYLLGEPNYLYSTKNVKSSSVCSIL